MPNKSPNLPQLADLDDSGALPLANPRHERFAQVLAAGASKAEAYLQAGYKAKNRDIAGSCGFRLVKKAKVRRRLAFLQSQLAGQAAIEREDIARELAAVGFANLTDAVRWENGQVEVEDSDTLPPNVRSALQRVVQTRSKDGSERVEVSMHSKLEALRDLARLMDLLPKDDAQQGPTVVVVAPEKLDAHDWMERYAPPDVRQALPILPPGAPNGENSDATPGDRQPAHAPPIDTD